MRKLATLSLVIAALSLSACGGDEVDPVAPGEELRLEQCGTIAGIACPRGQYCDLGVGQCGVADAAGVCRTIPQGCTTDYAPVCGCDGKTYGNACEAARAGVSVDHAGACVPPPVTCGGIAGLACPEGQYCRYAVGACRIPDATGACAPRPQGCTADYVPVCGCDGKTYGNACEAARAGVSVNHAGACVPPPGSCGAAGASCGVGQFCQYPEGQCGGAAGRCTTRPQVCLQYVDPVCGCDGRTYYNPCAAAGAGVSVRYHGSCR